MKEFFFPYKRIHSDIFGEVKIPVAKIFLKGGEEIGVDAIVDSGAIVSIFPKSLSEILGLNFEKGKKASVRTATGEEIKIRIQTIELRIGDYCFKARVAFSENETSLTY